MSSSEGLYVSQESSYAGYGQLDLFGADPRHSELVVIITQLVMIKLRLTKGNFSYSLLSRMTALPG